MFNSPVLDVCIGLILVYLLYSLLVTIVGEIICNWIGLRARILRVSIEKMLNDGYYANLKPKQYRGFWYRVQRYFLKEFPDFKHSFAGKFYHYPAIKYLSMRAGEQTTVVTQTKPSYLSAEVFADSLIQLLKDKGAGETDMDKVHFSLNFNTYHIQPDTLRNLRNMAEVAGPDINVFKEKLKIWFNETQDRTTGWYKSKLQLILFALGIIIAIIFNVDSIKIARILSKDKDARNQLVSMGIALAKDSARYGKFTGSPGDTGYAQNILDSGYAHVSKDLHDANLVLGLGWNLDTLLQAHQVELSSEDKAFALVAKDAARLNELQQKFHTKQTDLVNDLENIDNTRESLKDLKVKLLTVPLTDTTTVQKEIDAAQKQLQIGLESKSRDSLSLQVTGKRIRDIQRSINAATGNEFTIIKSVTREEREKKSFYVVSGSCKYSFWGRVGHFFATVFWYGLPGFVITALMLSLGAPFWFDLLKKLVSVRGDGVKPEEKPVKKKETEQPAVTAGNKPQEQPANVEPVGDVIDEALKLYEKVIKSIPGVKTVFKVVDRKTKQKQLQINVDTAGTAQEVGKKFPTLSVGSIQLQPLIVVSGTPQTHQGNVGTIANKSGRNGFGSLGCILRRTDTNSLHMLSCWHVLKGDTLYDTSDNLDIIIDNEEEDCAQRWAGGIKAQFDYGLARITTEGNTFNTTLKQKLKLNGPIKFRELTTANIEDQIEVQYYDSLNQTVRTGFIFANARETNVNYLDKTRVINDLLLLTNDDERTISNPGNSGSIVFDKKNGAAIAMIISGDLKYTYAVKLSHIFDIHTEMIIA
ncbi:hypothetical protein A3860_13645 [Niastella vici]|uniref:Uncharacterized protein n=1 Tax=Niastella vici TaxID=1703345 RepID=A0A1V9G7D4_9BACT|nr:hypothetical protein [Niastella vici]OQP66523.1 hypothetical protein A3860_13645 [Niastella vici]